MFNLLPCPNSIRYSWFWSGPQRQTRGDSSLWPPGTVTKLPSGTSPGPPQNPKIQNPKSPKSQIPKIPKSKIPKIQNPQNPKIPKIPKSKIPKIPKAKIQNPHNPKSKIPKIPKSKIPKIPKSKIPKIQNPSFFARILGILDLGFCIIRKQFFTWGPQRPKFWILDFGDFGFWGFWILDFGDFGFWGFWILDFGEFGFWILGPESQIQNPKSPKSKILNPKSPKSGQKSLDFGFWGFWIFGILGIWDFGFWILGILDFGFLEHYVADLYVQSLDFGIWDLGFWGFGILDFGDFGFWGSWILDFGLGILDGHLVTKFWMLHKKRRLCTPNRVGGFLKTLYISASSALRKQFFNSVADAPRRRSRLLREKSFGKMVNFAWRSTTSDARQRKQINTMIHAQETMTVTLISFVVMIFWIQGLINENDDRLP